MTKPIIISGITATGKLTLGNYIGAIKSFVELQDKYELFIFIADLHALTNYIDPKQLAQNRRDILALYIACGLDPKKVTLFYQSDVLEHTQLGWIFENTTSIGELSRMTQYKDKAQKQAESNAKKSISTSLLTYPTLMAADILLYNAELVPVGQDQKQHLELTQIIAERFNRLYGETFKVPKPFIPKIGAKIMSLTDPTKKMSKSDSNNRSYIALLDDPQEAAKKIIKAKTDSENKVYISDNKPGVKNLLTIYSVLNNIDLSTAEKHFKDSENYVTLKNALSQSVVNLLEKIQKKYQQVLKDIDNIAEQGAITARKVASLQMKKVLKKMGFYSYNI